MKTLSTGIGFAVGMVVATQAFGAKSTDSSHVVFGITPCDVDRHQCPKFRRGL
jgi:hypothetical protein